MGEQTKLRQILKNLVKEKPSSKDSKKQTPINKPTLSVLHPTQQAKKKPTDKNDKNTKIFKIKAKKPTTVEETKQTELDSELAFKIQMAKKVQMALKEEKKSDSPLQMHLIQSESLNVAQNKINELEEELYQLRQKQESLASASEVLTDKNEWLKSKLEDIKYTLKEEKNNFKEEKKVLLATLKDAKKQMDKLQEKKQELEKRLSKNLQGVRSRENSLESRIEILKMESSILQREKDKKIIQLQSQMQDIKTNLEKSHKQNQNWQTLNNKLQESLRRAVSALRATIHNLEGINTKSNGNFITETNDEN